MEVKWLTKWTWGKLSEDSAWPCPQNHLITQYLGRRFKLTLTHDSVFPTLLHSPLWGLEAYQTAILPYKTLQESPNICHCQLHARPLVCSLQGKSVYHPGFMPLGRVEPYLRPLSFPRRIIYNLYLVCSQAHGLVMCSGTGVAGCCELFCKC